MTPGIVVSHHALKVPTRGRPLRVAYASDFHAGPTTDPVIVSSAFDAILASRPNVVLLGGDFVNFEPTAMDDLVPGLSAIAKQVPCYAVLGNHDWVTDPVYISARLENIGIEVLTNRSVRLQPPFDTVWICGLDDHLCGRPDANATFSEADGLRIVLMHAPSGLLDIGAHRFDLALCGHTHGGQVALPGGRPILLPGGALSRRYSRGRFQMPGGGTLIVSVGVGCAMLPFRLHADPEVLTCTLTDPSSPEQNDAVEDQAGTGVRGLRE
jgi:predicted MPP superfamily phosphohydrolase